MQKKRLIEISLLLACFVIIPAFCVVGAIFSSDHKFLFVGAIIVIYSLLPFFISFEKSHPKPREIVIIAAMSAIAIAGRAVFFMLPQFKPMSAIVIIAGVCLGARAGFLVGAVSALVSNFIFGQGPWTVFQMLGFGFIGLLAGFIFHKHKPLQKALPIAIYGGIATFIIYGGLVNASTIVVAGSGLTLQSILAVYIAAIPFDLMHAGATVIFLMMIANPFIKKLTRVIQKYGII